jgi:hypothetical protein
LISISNVEETTIFLVPWIYIPSSEVTQDGPAERIESMVYLFLPSIPLKSSMEHFFDGIDVLVIGPYGLF